MAENSYTTGRRRRGFFASLGLAYRIALGGLRLLRLYPKVVLPLIPIFFMVILTILGFYFIQSLILWLLVVFCLAYALMFSFAITGQMLKQIHEGRGPSILEAFAAPGMVRMIPRVLLLSMVWYFLVLVLVIIETAVRTILGRISDNLADVVIGAIFGTLADVLRMAGFMLVAIMVFEDVGLSPAFKQMRITLKDNPIVALGGLVLTKMASFLIFGALMVVGEFMGDASFGFLTEALMFVLVGLGWMLAIYLEQIFVTGLYLYSTAPDSPLVGIILRDQIGQELPELPAPELT
jgi:hypothetical protein